MAEETVQKTLQHQLDRYEAAIAEFLAIEAQLSQQQPRTARLADMLRVNRETINAMQRSASLVRERLVAATPV